MRIPILLTAIYVSMLGCAPEPKHTDPGLQISSGIVQRIDSFPSQFIAARNVDVWLPEDYSPQKQYAVLYMHDGQMLFDSTTTWNKQEWGADEVMGQLAEKGAIQPTILVGIWNTELRHSEYFPQKPFESLPQPIQDSLLEGGSREGTSERLFKTKLQSDHYLRFIVAELKPFIDSAYATNPDRDHTFIAGSSMGGLISMYAICEYPEVFGGAACLSTHWVGVFDTTNNPIPAQFAAYMDQHLPDPTTHKLYFDYGTETLDALYEPSQQVIDTLMVQHGYDTLNWTTIKFEGADHSERAWHKRLDIPLTFLLSKEDLK